MRGLLVGFACGAFDTIYLIWLVVWLAFWFVCLRWMVGLVMIVVS